MKKLLLVLAGSALLVAACTKKDNNNNSPAQTDEQAFRAKFANHWWNIDSLRTAGTTIDGLHQAIMFCSGDSTLNKDLSNNTITNNHQKWHYKSPTLIVVDGEYSNSAATNTTIKGLTDHYFQMDLDSGTGTYGSVYLSR